MILVLFGILLFDFMKFNFWTSIHDRHKHTVLINDETKLQKQLIQNI